MKALAAVAVAAIVLLAIGRSQRSTPPPAAVAVSGNTISFRVVFGYQRNAPRSYDGSVSVTGGSLKSLEPWEFLQADSITPPNSWRIRVRRIVFENQPDHPNQMSGGGPPAMNLVPAGVIVTVDSSAASANFQTQQGNFSIPVREVAFGRQLWYLDGDVQVERVPAPERVSPPSAEEHDYPSIAVTRKGEVWTAWQAYQDRGDHVYACRRGGEAVRLTTDKGDVYRTAVGEDDDGRVHVVWSERRNVDWNLYERVWDGRSWSAQAMITAAGGSNIFHKVVSSTRGLKLVWVGHENGLSYLYTASYSRARGWSQPQTVGGPGVWSPDAAADRDGNLHVAWDSYQNGNYDIFYRQIAADGTLGTIEQVTRSPRFEAHASLAVDAQGRPWLAWDQSGANWGKDWTHDDPNRSTVLYKDRSIRVAVKDQGAWKEAPDFSAAVPDRLRRYWQLPRLMTDGTGRVWALFQIRTSALNNRDDYWCAGGLWDLYLTTLDGGVWRPASIVPHSTGRNESSFQMAAGADRVWMTWATDGRSLSSVTGGFQARTMVHYDVFAAPAAMDGGSGTVQLTAMTERPERPQSMHPNEAEDVRKMRGYRAAIGGTEYRILRGDFHRHTDISNDGSGDGSIEDYYRYMIDVAAMDTGVLTDHNMGGDVEYNWWRTEKSYDIFHFRDGYTPLFGYERSVNYPNGHRNVVFDHRGVRTLPVRDDENQGKVNSGSLVYPYLRQNRGICMEHSLATGQGTDWRDNDPDLEPLVEIYQGYHAAYEYEGGPRAESAGNNLIVHGSYEPAGFYWNALKKGFKLGVQASSDHISTHTSYAMIYTPSTNRTDIVDSMRLRHAYAATDNILLDFGAVETDGTAHMMGDIFNASPGLKLRAKIGATDVITRVDVIRNNAIIYTAPEPGKKDMFFEYVDRSPESGTNWYYVRVTQIDRNLAWSSPVWVTYKQ